MDVSKPLAGGALAVEDVSDGDLLTKLSILTTGRAIADAGEWIRERIALDFAYPCVEDPDELAALDKGLSLGGVVKRNRHTVEKDDRFTSRQDYVLGFDNASKLELVAAQVGGPGEANSRRPRNSPRAARIRTRAWPGSSKRCAGSLKMSGPGSRSPQPSRRRNWPGSNSASRTRLAAQADLEPLRANIEAVRQKHQSSTRSAAVLQSEYKALDHKLTTADSACWMPRG